MPDDYYISQYSGEEIDELLGGAGAGTVRYDAAQSLTDAQKTQARGNIAAAPDGFGLGGRAKLLSAADDLNNILTTGWYSWAWDAHPKNAPDNNLREYGCAMYVFATVPGGYAIQTVYDLSDDITHGCAIQRTIYSTSSGAVYYPWEWVNPPMLLGVEYRTTERYNGQPVYCKLVNFGALPNATQKVVKHNIPNVSSVISVYGSAQDQAIGVGAFGAQVTGINADNTNVAIWTSADLSNYSAYVAIKYTKTTD